MSDTKASPIIYSIDANDIIHRISGGWDAFAVANGNPKMKDSFIGKKIWSFIATEKVQTLYKKIFDAVRSTQNDVTLGFRCDSDKVLRFMEMSIKNESQGLSIKTELLREIPRKVILEREILYMAVNNGRPMCSQCNKIYVPPVSSWMEIDDALAKKYIIGRLSVNFTICDECYDTLDHISEKLSQR